MNMKRFVVIVDRASASDAAAVMVLIKQANCAWWHWMNDLWLLADQNPEASVATWLYKVHGLINPSTRVFILELTDGLWSVFAPPEAHAWLEEHWGKKLPPTPFQQIMDQIEAEADKAGQI
jgi:hypothetical protein